jgi:dTDP-4-dehydrorhamnose reductase
MKSTILVTGANGQLGQCLQQAASKDTLTEWIFCSSAECDITSESSVMAALSGHTPAIVINCAAYTAVDKAEDEEERAFQVNSQGVKILATACDTQGTALIHLSTDYVFDGKQTVPYVEDADCSPLTVYGQSKRGGEIEALQHCARTIVVRTSWVYSEYGSNFVKTMLRLGGEKESLTIVTDQVGNPTNAHDLAAVLITMTERILTDTAVFGIFHYTNTGDISWYDFATEIMGQAGLPCTILPTTSEIYIQKAPRPRYSVLDTTKIMDVYAINPKPWKESLASTLATLR